MSYGFSMLFCIKLVLYLLDIKISLKLYTKQQKLPRISQFLKNFLRNLDKSMFLMEVALEYYFTYTETWELLAVSWVGADERILVKQ